MNQPANKSFPVTWDQFHRDSRALAWRLTGMGTFDAVVAIARGGLVPATIVARELNIRVVESVAVKSYDHQNQGSVKVLKPIAPQILDMVRSGGKPASGARRPGVCRRRSMIAIRIACAAAIAMNA